MKKTEFLNKVEKMGFKYLRVSLTKDCNAACSFCHNEGQETGKRGNKSSLGLAFLTLEEYKYIARFFKGCLQSVSLTGGEPSLVQNLPEIISIFKNEGYSVRMTTNAFLLDDSLQKQLKKAGLDAINISLSTLKTDKHNKMFNVKDKLPIVLENLKSLSHNFPNQVKINFMALEGVNVPEQLLPISELSAKLAITISFLTTLDNDKTVSLHVLEYLKKHLNIVTKKEIESKFGKKAIYIFNNGSIWEFDDFREDKYKEIAFDNDECQNCFYRKNCVEGPYALRISYNGDIRPCLIRKDNVISLIKEGAFDEQ